MKNNKRDIKLKDLVWLIVIIIITIVALVIYLKEYTINKKIENESISNSNSLANSSQQQEKKTSQVEIQRTDEDITKHLSNLGERGRMEYYCGEYIKCLKNKEYEKAYNMLYPEFKEKYFPSLEEYEKYVKNFYPEFFAVQYDDFSRQGNIYVIRLIIIDAMNSEKKEENVQRIVVKENNFNDFVISFQVK